MLIPKESQQLISADCSPSTEIDNKEAPELHGEKLDAPPERAKLAPVNVLPENALTNGVNGEIKPQPLKCMNILQNIIIKKEEHDHCIQIPIKREIDEDTLNNRIKIPRRELPEVVIQTMIKQEVLDIKAELPEVALGQPTDGETAGDSKTEVHTCFRCNMIFMEKEAFTNHVKECGKIDSTYPAEALPSGSCNDTNSNRCIGKQNFLIHVEQIPRLIESIRNTPCLYNTNFDGYNNLDLKEQMWSRIAVECNYISTKLTKATWKKLVQEFCDLLNKRQTNSVTDFRYEQQMQFMLPYINNPTTRNEHQHCDNYTPNYSRANFSSVSIASEIVDDDDAQSVIRMNTPRKRARVSTPYVVRPAERELPPLTTLNTDRAIDLFYMSMSESTKMLPVQFQLQVKKKVFALVLEAEEIAHRVNPIRTEPFSPPPSPGNEQFQY